MYPIVLKLFITLYFFWVKNGDISLHAFLISAFSKRLYRQLSVVLCITREGQLYLQYVALLLCYSSIVA